MGRDCVQGPALYVQLEGRRKAVRDHFAAMEANPDDPVHIYHGPPLDEPFVWLRQRIRHYDAVLAVIDPLFRFYPFGDGSDYATVTAGMQPYIDIASETGCTICMVHHARKAGGRGGEEALGSQNLFGSVDVMITLRRKGTDRTPPIPPARGRRFRGNCATDGRRAAVGLSGRHQA